MISGGNMNISEPVEMSVLSADAKDALTEIEITTTGQLFSITEKQLSDIRLQNKDIANELTGFIRRNTQQAERAGISIDYDVWLLANEKYVQMYAKENDIGIGKLGLSADTYKYLSMYGISMFSNLIGRKEKEVEEEERRQEEKSKERMTETKNRLHERKNERIGFTDKIKHSEIEAQKQLDDSEEIYTPLGNRNNILQFADFVSKNCDLPMTQMTLSVRASNCLERNEIKTLSDMIRLYPDGYSSMMNAGAKTTDEIKKTVEDIYNRYEHYYNGLNNMSPEKSPKEKKNSETSAFSKNELFAEYIAANHEVSVGMLDLSVRTYNCLKRNDIMTLSKIILAYPDDLKSMKNFGNKSFGEIEKLMYELHGRYDEQFLNSSNDTDDRKTDLISSMTIHELLSSDKYRHFINDFFEHLNLRIDNSGLSGKALRYLGKAEITEFNKLFVLYPDRIVSVAGSSNAVADELKKYIENTVSNYRLR